MSITVWIVEDDVEARKVFSRWIGATLGLKVLGDSGSAEEAIKSLADCKPNIVLMDINLPGISGVEAIKRLKPGMPNTQFVMLTVYEDANHIYDALAAGATGYLLKQTSREELIASLQEVQNGGSPITSNIARKVVQFFHHHPAPADICEPLSPREREVLELVTKGCPYKEIAFRLNISIPTVSTYIRRAYEKLHVCSRAQAVAKFALQTQGDQRVPGPSGS
jgi:DNA-binding NarL/FixJ family response regulator